MAGFKHELLRLQPGVLPMRYTHPHIPYELRHPYFYFFILLSLPRDCTVQYTPYYTVTLPVLRVFY